MPAVLCCVSFGYRVACLQTLVIYSPRGRERDGEIGWTNAHGGASDAAADSTVDRRCVGVYADRYGAEPSSRKFTTCIDATDTKKKTAARSIAI